MAPAYNARGMPNMQRFVFVCLIVTALTSCTAQAKEAKAASAPLGLTVRTDHEAYRMSGTIRMETQLLNTGNDDVYIWEWDLCWNFARGLSMQFVKQDGTRVDGDLLFDCVPPPPKEGNVYAFIKLEPERFYGLVDEIKVTDVVKRPGEYDIIVTYGSSISRGFIKEFLKKDPISELPVWTMEKPTLKAPRIHVSIRP